MAGETAHTVVDYAGPTTSTAVVTNPSAIPTRIPAYVARVRWVPDARGRSLRVYPTAAARTTQDPAARTTAWRQVVHVAPAANTVTMHAQFDCHWSYARIADPSKPSWNLETWRPVVSAQTMFDTRCNPGGPEE
ncbi:DUF2599 domain-containing protein [Allobranchiibius sp. CTAmp26]|uniref:DUF2599 domain-containing protein n=1 Tax=Allobranchiibius sp. CTAmp26 TaxID=2815214 RepID=UPI001AA19C32|nr:DUF2599 domain-containing protein [Allobranchiibius sp. CTAmp26]MBO1754036.1 DUF2599 domain-containing protein [Allobranchiibius sp. CTAmp26]